MYCPQQKRIVSFPPNRVQTCVNQFRAHQAEWAEYMAKYEPRPAEPWEHDTTIAVKTFVRPHYLVRFLKSVRDKYSHVRVILVDDGILRFLPDGKQGLNILSIHQPYLSGLAQGRNVAVDHATTKYMYILDDDMFLDEESDLGKLYDFMESRPDIHLCAARHSQIESRCAPNSLYAGIYEIKDNKIVVTQPAFLKKEGDVVFSHRALNCFIARTESLRLTRWEDVFYASPEHAEFFYRFASVNQFMVCTNPVITIQEDDSLDTQADDFSYDFFRNQMRELLYSWYLKNKFGRQFMLYYEPKPRQTQLWVAFERFQRTLDTHNVTNVLMELSALGFWRQGELLSEIEYILIGVQNTPIDCVISMCQHLPCQLRWKYQGGLGEWVCEYQDPSTSIKVRISNIVLHGTIPIYTSSPTLEPLFALAPTYSETREWAGKKVCIWTENMVKTFYGPAWVVPQNYVSDAAPRHDLCHPTPVPIPSTTFIKDFFKDNVFCVPANSLPYVFTYMIDTHVRWALFATDSHSLTTLDPAHIGLIMQEALRGTRKPQLILLEGDVDETQTTALDPLWNVHLMPYRLATFQTVRTVKLFACTYVLAAYMASLKSANVQNMISKVPHVKYVLTSDMTAAKQTESVEEKPQATTKD